MEEWKPVVGYEGLYEVSSLGNIRSLERNIVRSDGVVTHIRAKMICPVLNEDGYRQCKLCRNGKHSTKRVHRIVAEAFIDNPYGYDEVNHIDSNRENNCVENLEWINHRENVYQAIREGRHFCTRNLLGKNNPNYGNTALHDYYCTHPEKALELLARHGGKNGRAVAIELYDSNMCLIKKFSCIKDCAVYLKDKYGFVQKIRSLCERIAIVAH